MHQCSQYMLTHRYVCSTTAYIMLYHRGQHRVRLDPGAEDGKFRKHALRGIDHNAPTVP